MSKPLAKHTGFTIVELLIGIVVIAILATLTIVAYSGIQQKAIGASLQSDLKEASSQLKIYQVDNGAYPTSNDCTTGATPAPPKICLKSSPGNSYGSSYSANNSTTPQTFTLTATHDDIAYVVTDSSAPLLVVVIPIVCPTGYIVVPGSSTYGTVDFCTMRYEAKNVSGVATSQAGGTPWVSVSQTTALSTATAACGGCHLITEPEWMTITQNVLSVASNWSGGAVGSGYIYSGHNNGSSALDADTNNANGYYATGDISPSNQRRTLTLSNGEVIWDLSGNVYEWTAGSTTTGQPGISVENFYTWKEWGNVDIAGSLSTSVLPASTGLPGSGGWASDNGIGQLYSNSSETVERGFIRGGSWGVTASAGVLTLRLGYAPSTANTAIGFRVSR